VARNAFALALLMALGLAGCSKLPFLGNKKAKEAEVNMAALRARTDSLRKARQLADSMAQARQVACVDSVRIELGKAAAIPKGKSKKKKRQERLSEDVILAKAGTACTEMALPPSTIASTPPAPAVSAADTAKPAPSHDSAKPGIEAAGVAPTGPITPVVAATPSSDSVVWADSVRKAKEIEMSRETFSYGGASRDPFVSLLNMAKNGPELADLQLVGIYQNLRMPANSVAVFREKDGGKRHKLRAGDQVGRSRLVQIRDRDVVFMIEDFGFERQETLSLRKQEDVIP
jgi:hypothetical protein